ncbi:hypothetical protein MTR_1g053275 [Medicago truncatula]|uniref:Uncharacterized protein n=1 Tax=Medicago truncatula TaxID=3880 RepID=A0A072VJ55_MEDTR|nr:hypothetical protein MTR_1g053275 [Medicago truncatula]
MFHRMKQPSVHPTYYHHQLPYHVHSIPKSNIFFHQILIQNHSSIKHRSYVELCHGKLQQLTAEENFGSVLPRKTSVVKTGRKMAWKCIRIMQNPLSA